VKVGVEAVEGVVSLSGLALQLLPPTSKARRADVRKSMNEKESGGGTVDPQRLVQRPVERSAVVTELLPQPLLCLGVDEVGRRGAGML
jgi:hypothetical protein